MNSIYCGFQCTIISELVIVQSANCLLCTWHLMYSHCSQGFCYLCFLPYICKLDEASKSAHPTENRTRTGMGHRAFY